MMRHFAMLVGVLAVAGAATGQETSDADRAFAEQRDKYLSRFKPLWLESAAAWWEANITGTDAAYARKKAADKALVDLHSDRAVFARLKELKERGQVRDQVLRRELDVMYRAYLPGQADPDLQKRIVELESEVEQVFNTFRSRVGEKTLSENEVREILATTTDSARAEAAWKAYMEVGQQAESRLRELVRLRNRMARELGLRDFYALQLVLQEIDERELLGLFDELDALTREPFAKLKADIDVARAARFQVAVADLRPWHFGDLFFQEVPDTGGLKLDDVFKEADLLAVATRYFAGLGLEVGDILARSDLYEKPGKCPHAFSHDMDRAGDVRILTNLVANAYWANTLLHELGHAVYDKYIAGDVPFLLRTASHGITTEGIALLFGAMTNDEQWLREVLHVDAGAAGQIAQVARQSARTGQLIFSRWAQVMVRFEREMYGNPDQDLARLWWDLKRRYQLLSPPDRLDRPDYAAKTHILTTPAYYHCYLMGELFAAQVRQHIRRQVVKVAAGESGLVGRPEVGAYLREKVFAPGNLYPWDELTRRATGEPLSAKYFAQEFVR